MTEQQQVHACNQLFYDSPSNELSLLIVANKEIEPIIQQLLGLPSMNLWPVSVFYYTRDDKLPSNGAFNRYAHTARLILPNNRIKIVTNYVTARIDHSCYYNDLTIDPAFVISIHKQVVVDYTKRNCTPDEDQILTQFRTLFDVDRNVIESGTLLLSEEFPNDCMLHILTYCDVQTLLDFSLVSKRANEFADMTVWKYLFNQLDLTERLEASSYKNLCCELFRNYMSYPTHLSILKYYESELSTFEVPDLEEWKSDDSFYLF